jgi:hypothetical protein
MICVLLYPSPLSLVALKVDSKLIESKLEDGYMDNCGSGMSTSLKIPD